MLCVCAGKPADRPSKSCRRGSRAGEVKVAERPGVVHGRSLVTDRRPAELVFDQRRAAFRQNGDGRINRTVLRDCGSTGRVHCSICNNVNNTPGRPRLHRMLCSPLHTAPRFSELGHYPPRRPSTLECTRAAAARIRVNRDRKTVRHNWRVSDVRVNGEWTVAAAQRNNVVRD